MEEMFEGPVYADPVVDRGEVLIKLAEAVERTSNFKSQKLLHDYMDKVLKSIKLPPQAQLTVIEGGKTDA
jgi:hypothetical protein